ncbi:MAG: carbon-nitrogen family hydrolase [Actinomycetota bacterium]
MKFALVQHDIVWCERQENFARLAPKIESAAADGAGLVLLSETFSTGFAVEDDRFAEPEGGPSSRFLAEMARTHGVWVGGSCPEIPTDTDGGADRRPANTFVLCGADGTVHRYRKIHPFTFGGEDRHVRPGAELVTVNIDGLQCSLFVCYDLRFADEFWQVARDTDVYLVPANWPDSRREHWMTLLRARAIENQAFVVGCNRVGRGGQLTYCGDSRIIGPFGEEIAVAGDGECTITAEITAEHVAATRDRFRFLQDRRT